MSSIQIRKSLKVSVLNSFLNISFSASTGDRDPGLERSQPSQCCLRSVGQRGQKPVQSWLWRNGEQTAWPTLTFTHALQFGDSQIITGQVCDHWLLFFVSLCWDGAAIMSKGWKISAWQRQAVDSRIYGGSREVIFIRGVCFPCCRSSYTRVSNRKLSSLVETSLSFFWKGPIRSQGFRADLSFVILIGESQGYTASAAELRQSEPPVWLCYFCFVLKH